MKQIRLIATILLLTITTISSGGCSQIFGAIRVKVESDCIWFTEQKLTDETKEWLSRHPEMENYRDKKGVARKRFPIYVRQDFNKYRINNKNAEKFCPELRSK